MHRARLAAASLFALLVTLLVASSPARAQSGSEGSADAPPRTDYLTFAAGLLPLSLTGAGAELGASHEALVEATDGDPTRRVLNLEHADADTDFVMLFRLPALTTFDRLAIPNVIEVRSAGTSFAREVEVHGSATGPDEGFELLASATLKAHAERGEVTELEIVRTVPVRWVRLRLKGALDPEAVFIEFSELVGHGTQEPVPLATHFTGLWSARTGAIELHQEGVVVNGCVDGDRKRLVGSVTGNLLRATLVDNATGIGGAMLLAVEDDGTVWGLRSDNGAPFRVYGAEVAGEGTSTPCSAKPTAVLGCGDVVHGLQFAHDSATLLPDSEPVLDSLYEGLGKDPKARVVIVGHTSSEGSDDYNQRLSERRAQAVVDALAARGLEAERLSGEGRGESEPIAKNDTETGRVLNRRVEITCAEP